MTELSRRQFLSHENKEEKTQNCHKEAQDNLSEDRSIREQIISRLSALFYHPPSPSEPQPLHSGLSKYPKHLRITIMSTQVHGKEDAEISIASATPTDKRSTELDFGNLEKGQDDAVSEHPGQLKRGLKSRHLQMIAVSL